MQRRNLLICFDAFGTLFTPRKPVHQQYGEVARSFGLVGVKDDDVKASFKTGALPMHRLQAEELCALTLTPQAFKKEAKENPNYGKANGMNAEKWWTNIINNTFQPLLGSDQNLPSGLVLKLLNRFWCDEGYVLFPDVLPFIQRLRQQYEENRLHVVVGVITNSDDRVPAILASLGMRVNTLRYGDVPADSAPNQNGVGTHEIDFSVMSYDVGHEKPDKRIFLAAEEMLQTTLKTRQDSDASVNDPSGWHKLYVGDEYDKDVVGALAAEWNAVLVDRETSGRKHDVQWLDGKPSISLSEDLQFARAFGCSSLAKLSESLSLPP